MPIQRTAYTLPLIDYLLTCLFPAEFAFIHSKFLAQLPSTVDEFRHSLHLVFPHVYDINHLMEEIGCLRKGNDLPQDLLYLKRRFSGPIHMEIPQGGKHSSFLISQYI